MALSTLPYTLIASENDLHGTVAICISQPQIHYGGHIVYDDIKQRATEIIIGLEKEHVSAESDNERAVIAQALERYRRFMASVENHSLSIYKKTYLIYGNARIAIDNGGHYYHKIYSDMADFERYLAEVAVDPRDQRKR